MRIPFEVRIQQLQSLRGERSAALALLGGLHAYVVGEVVLSRLVAVPVATKGEESPVS